MSQMNQWVQRGQAALIQNYARSPICMSRGEGSRLWDADGKEYLDLFAGFGGAILGHCHPALVEAATQQAQKLWHVGNTFYTEPQIEFAERLQRFAFAGQAFFCHSGAEANEAACKLARLAGQSACPRKWKIITLHRSFHGRTLAMIAATGNPKVRDGFAPDVPGFVHVEGGDIAALEAAIDDETCGVLMEPIQGEGGMNVWPAGYPAQVRQLCDRHQLTLIFDEVWTGCGRTGKWFGHQYFTAASGTAVLPDIMTLGKAVGGGLPVGVMLARPHAAALLNAGKHGSTLGGNPICMAVAKTIFDQIESQGLLRHALQMEQMAMEVLANHSGLSGRIAQVRGHGLFLGVELKDAPNQLVERALQRGLIINVTAQKVVRLAPALNINPTDWARGLNLVKELICES